METTNTYADKASTVIQSLTKPNSKEGTITKKVENITSKFPSIGYLGLALGSMALSASLAAFTQKKSLANFVGLWVPSFMLIGIYNKLVKLEGNDAQNRPRTTTY